MASPKIKTPVDLKGKVIAVTSASGGSWMFTTLALEYWGLDAKRDGSPFAFSAMSRCAAKRFY
jgi:ABC-type nitrate/sulfonate/bicarbonate transport system substrate-binding protein